ncbi:c-type cytochrome [Roseateles microcysteis]|uniref:c-type cytochrome n=1 Tax=Roseateles microcysteis TaxID=3119057 RepID=UPI002FE63CA0
MFAFALACLAVASQAQDRKIESAIKHRKSAFTLMSTYVNRLVQTSEGGRPYNAAQSLEDARAVEFLSRLPWEGFVPGSERGDTRAKDDIWFEEDRFKTLATELQSRAGAMTKAAESGNLPRLRSTIDDLRDVCSRCHKVFRKD